MGQSNSKEYSSYSLVSDSDKDHNFVLERMGTDGDIDDSSEDEIYNVGDKQQLTDIDRSNTSNTHDSHKPIICNKLYLKDSVPS